MEERRTTILTGESRPIRGHSVPKRGGSAPLVFPVETLGDDPAASGPARATATGINGVARAARPQSAAETSP